MQGSLDQELPYVLFPMQIQYYHVRWIKSVTLYVYIFHEWRCKRIIWRVAGCEQDGSLSYRMRNVFIQPDSYHNLPVMNERPLCEDAERSEIKRRVINRPVALNDLRVHSGKNRNESISRTLPVQSVTIYKTSSFSLFFLLFSTSHPHLLLSPYRYPGSRAAGEISLNSSHVLRARLTNSVSLNVSPYCAMLSYPDVDKN